MWTMTLDNAIIIGCLIFSVFGVIFLAHTLFRVITAQNKIYKEIRQGTYDLQQSGQKLYAMLTLAEELTAQLGAESGAVTPELEARHELSDATLAQSVQKFESLTADMRTLMSSIMDIKPEGFESWRDSNAQLISKVQAEHQSLAPDILRLQVSIDRIGRSINRVNPATSGDHESSKELKEKLDSYQKMVIQARERAKSAENTVADLQMQIDLLKAKNERLHDADADGGGNAELHQELDTVKQECKLLMRQIDNLTNEINRTKIEKDFIEDKFIELS